MKPIRVLLSAVALSLVVVGCGGGDGEQRPTPVASSQSFALSQPYRATVLQTTSTRSFRAEGRASGLSFSGSGTLTLSAPTPSSFEGVAATGQTQDVAGRVSSFGQSRDIATRRLLFTNPSSAFAGVVDGGGYRVPTATFALPATGRVGEVGLLFDAINYTDSTKATRLGTSRSVYSIEADTASSVLLKIFLEDTSTANAQTYFEVQTFRLSADGRLDFVRIEIRQGSDQLVLNF